MKMTRIASIIEEGRVGGPQVRMIEEAAALNGRAETVIIMPTENSEEFRTRCEAAGVAYRAVPLSRLGKGWRVGLRYLLFCVRGERDGRSEGRNAR